MNKTLFTKIFSALLIVITVLGAIPVTPAYAATSGPNLPDVGNNVNGPGTVNWTNPGNVISDNNVYATVAVNNSTSEYLQATDFDFAIPAGATINGIQVTIGRFGTTGMGQDIQDNVVQLIKGGTLVGNNLGATATDWPNGEAAANYGAANNLWGTTWTPAEINALDFGVALAVDSTNNRTASVDYIQVTVTYSLNSTTVGVATATAGSNSSINVSMPYTDDGDADNTYTVEYCLTSANCPVSGSWTTFVSGAAHSASPFATSITGLSPATSYDVRVTYNDLDGVTGTNPQTLTNVTTLACGSSLTYTAPAGSNRVVVVVVSSESGGGAGAVITGVTIGGTAATQISNLSNNGGSGGTYARLFVGYRVIGTSAVSEAMNIATTNGECIYANTYTGINQTTGTGATNTINSIATGTAASGTTTTSAAVTNQAGGQVVYAINMNGGTADGEVPTGISTGWTFSELFDRFNNPGGGNMTAIGQSTTTAAGSATISVGDNATDNHNRSILAGFALNPLPSATLTLQKTVVNDNGGTALDTAWTLAANGPTNISGVEGNAAVTNASVSPGTYTLTESGGPAGYTQTGLTCNSTSDPNPADGLTLLATENVTCVFTNDDTAPTLTLDKVIVNDNGGTALESAWTLTATGNPVTNPATLSGAGATGNTDVVSGATFDAGTYDLSESAGPAGYTASTWVCVGGTQVDADTVTIALGQNVTCTITNNDNVPTLTLNKVVVNDNGGTAAESAWTLTATGNPVTNPATLSGAGAAGSTDVVSGATFDAGTYDLSETAGPAGYTASAWVCVGGTQVDADTVTIALGQNVTCTITNNDIAPTLTLDKAVFNNNGGTAAESAWTLTATGNPVTNPATLSGAGAAGGTDVVSDATFDAGTYDLSESAGPAGYTASAWVCVGGTQVDSDTVTIALGQNVTCTIANNDNVPTLTLNKVVVNDNGGTAAESAWTLTATGNPVTNPATLSGAGAAGSTDVVSDAAFDAGTYDLSETAGPAGYTASAWVCVGGTQVDGDTITLALGQTATCTITNDDVAPTLTLLKDMVTDNGGTATDTDWTLNATGPTNISGIEGAAAITSATVSAGNYTLTESGGPAGYTQTGISCSGSDANGADGLILALGENVTCTFTNNDNAPSLTLLKTVVNNNGGLVADTAWTLNAAGPTNISGIEGAAGVTGATVSAGNYTLTESGGPTGYTQTGLSCSGAADLDPTDGLAIALGETITCTFTNDDVAPTLTLLKDVVTDNGGTATDTDWTLNAAGPTPISGAEGDASITSATVDAGNYTLTETGGPSGYTQTGIACTGSDANGADGLTLLPGETVTCTFTNNDVASTLTLVKTVVIDNGGTATDTDWTLNAAGPSPISGVEGVAAVTNAAVNAGSYTLTESGGPSGYTQTNLTCSGADDLNPNDGLNIGVGETITCTFTNNDIAPTLTLVKDVTNNDGGTTVIGAWTLSATGPDTISGVTGAGAVTNAVVDAGSYSLGESAITGYTQTAITCSGSDVNGADGLDLDPGENVTCTFFNDDIGGTLTLLKDVVNDNGGLATDTAWTLNATGPTTISGVEGAGAVTIANVSAGSYTLTESGPSGYTQTGLSCSGAADANPNDGLTIALSEVITCTFTNNDVAPTLTLVKNVTNNDGGTSVIGDWTLDASGPSAINGVTGAGTVTNAVVDAGSYSLSETGPTGYTQTAITCSGSDTNGADGLDLDPGENVTCTFFNDDIGATLTLLKDVINDNIGTAIDTDWTLTATGPTTISGVEGTAPVTSAGVSAGNYTLTESGPANYTQTAITCVGGTDANGADGLTLALGETVTCTFLNNDDVPVLLVPNVNSTPDTGDGSIAEGEVILNTLNVSKLTVQFNWDADNPAGITDTDDVNNPNNYILLYSSTGTFNTPSCAVVAGGGVVAPDIRIPVTTVTYNNGGGSGPFIATLNLGTTLTNVGHYRLFVCGTTSIVLAADPAIVLSGNGTPGTDFIRNFQINADPGNGGGGTSRDGEDELTVGALPATGFAPGRITALPIQPEELAYTSLGDLWIEIPALGVKSSIVGVPQTKEAEWNVTWLANNVGWLNGTAFPTWEGNSVLTAHVTNADGLAGPFANLTKLKFGDQIIVHAFGQKYIFELRNSRVVKPFSTSFAFEDLEDESYLTLITCQVYLPKSDTYLYRRVLRAVLVRIENE